MKTADAQAGLHAAAGKIVDELVQAWAAGDAAAFARPFAADARFVAFDGSVLQGPAEIARFHQQPFSTHLAGTRLQAVIDDVRTPSPGVVVLSSHGGIWRGEPDRAELTGHSVQSYVMLDTNGRLEIVSFQNTRERAITGAEAAQVWREFDQAWAKLLGSRS